MKDNKLGLWLLIGLVVGNMVGSGLFMLPSTLAKAANPAGVILAWLLTGFGVMLIALVFGNLAIRKPELTGGPQMYAKGLFKEGTRRSHVTGFLATWGYWISNIAGNVAIVTTFASYLSTFFPMMTNQYELVTIFGITIKFGNLLTFMICSSFLWINHMIIIRGIEGAGKLNLAATIAKVLGFAIFIVIGLWAFQKANIVPLMAEKVDSTGEAVPFLSQVSLAAMTTLWAFVGVESAVVFSSRARKKTDIKKATIIGLSMALTIYLCISILAMGVLTQDQLMASHKPLVDALSVVIGPSGSYVMAGLGLISLIGSALGWILLSAEVPFQASQGRMFISIFTKTNKHGAPINSLIITNLITQTLLLSTLSSSLTDAFEYVTTIAVLAVLIPYIIASIYQLKMISTGDTYLGQGRQRLVDAIIAIAATAYSGWMIVAGTSNWVTFLSGIILVGGGIIFYPFAQKKS